MPGKSMSEYDEARSLASRAVSVGELPFKIVITSAKVSVNVLRHVLYRLFKKEGIEDVGTAVDPDGDGLWLYRRK